VHYWKKIEIHI